MTVPATPTLRWLESLSPWPEDGFGLDRIRALLDALGNPQRSYTAVHVVGTKGKSTATRTIAATLRAEGVASAAYTSPHVSGWHERLETDEPGLLAALDRVRPEAETVGATQFEVLTAADVVVLPDSEFASLVPAGEVRLGGPCEAVEAVLGRPVAAPVEVELPGRLELRAAGVVRDGAHTPDAVDWLLTRLPAPGSYVVVASILADKDADGILERLGRAGSTLVATRSSSPRSLPAADVAARARPWFASVQAVDDPHLALAQARESGAPVLVTGSLYLLADLSDDR